MQHLKINDLKGNDFMPISNSPQPVQTSLASGLLAYARFHLRNRFVLLAITAGVIGFSAYFSWGWLVAAGIAPLLLTLAPCAAMCALGMCTMGGKSKIAPAIRFDDSADSAGKIAVGTVSPNPDSPATGKDKGNCC